MIFPIDTRSGSLPDVSTAIVDDEGLATYTSAALAGSGGWAAWRSWGRSARAPSSI